MVPVFAETSAAAAVVVDFEYVNMDSSPDSGVLLVLQLLQVQPAGRSPSSRWPVCQAPPGESRCSNPP